MARTAPAAQQVERRPARPRRASAAARVDAAQARVDAGERGPQTTSAPISAAPSAWRRHSLVHLGDFLFHHARDVALVLGELRREAVADLRQLDREDLLDAARVPRS